MASIDAALTMPPGAVWRRAALQVNPFAYHLVDNRTPPVPTEADYNAGLAAAFVSEGVDIVGITDHWRVRGSEGLRQELTAAGITVFPGFEATSSEGVHVLVLFDPSASVDDVQRRISECGVDARTGHSSPCDKQVVELLAMTRTWGAVAVPAHVTGGAGLLTNLTGQARIRAWQCGDLHAVAVSATPDQRHRTILEGTAPEYRRDHAVAVLAACDVNTDQDVAKPFATTWLKLSSPTAQGLDTAFRTPGTRVSRTDPGAHAGVRLAAVSWDGGFLHGVTLRLNEGLNVLIGGRGSGKSTVLESIRFAVGLKPVTRRGQDQHAQVITQVLGTAGKVTVLVECTQPSRRVLRIERTVGASPRVFDQATGDLLAAKPADLVPGVEVYGQRELADVADDKGYQTALLERLLPDGRAVTVDDVQQKLVHNRKALLDVDAERSRVDERLARLGVVEEKLRVYADTQAPQALATQRLHQREGRLFDVAVERVDDVADGVRVLRDAAGLDTTFLSPSARAGLPNDVVLVELSSVLDGLGEGLRELAEHADALVAAARERMRRLQQGWAETTSAEQQRLDVVLRDLSAAGIDAGDYLPLQAERDALQSLRNESPRLAGRRDSLVSERRTLLDELEERVAERTRRLDRAGRRVEGQPPLLRVAVDQRLDIDVLIALLRGGLAGRLDKVEEAVRSGRVKSGRVLSDLARQGWAALVEELGLTEGQARRLADAEVALLLELEEAVPSPFPVIELNIAEPDSPVWRPLEALSTGQKATALLLLLLNAGDAPLLVDQPEDDLDNRFISEGIVPRLRDQKSGRQFVLSTHNANIPVLADADLIAALATERDVSRVHAVLPAERVGSLDDGPVRELVEELLEGGKTAFETRRYRYGF